MKKSLVLHPFLFAAFPALFVFAHNMDQIRASMVPGPIVFTTFAAFLCWSLLSLVFQALLC